MNETGALIHINRQLLEGNDQLFFSVTNLAGDCLTIESRMCRQQRLSSDAIEVGLKFIDVDEKTGDSMIATVFSDSSAWNQHEAEPGIFRSLWSLVLVFKKIVKTSRKSHRSDLRLAYRENCRLVLPDRTLEGTVEQISSTGLSVNIPGTVDLVGENGTLYVESVALRVRRRWVMQAEGTVVAGFAIEQVEKGADRWQELTLRAA